MHQQNETFHVGAKHTAGTYDSTTNVDLPGQSIIKPNLEHQIEMACMAINKANAELEKVEHERSKALKQLAEAREKLLQKCNRAQDVLNTHEKPKSVTPDSYMPSI